MKNQRNKSYLIIVPLFIYLFFYAFVSGSFLNCFPFVHSDEAWLAGLTRDMQASGSFGATERFLAVKPRVPHAIKLLYHALQMGYINIFGYNIGAVRLLSLSAGLICLPLLYLIGKKLGGRWIGMGLMILVSCNIPFIYASHFARQEIMLCITILAVILILLTCDGRPNPRQTLLLAVITGLSVGIHPNSFLCATLCGCVLSLCGSRRDIRCTALRLLLYTAVTGMIAAVFIGISFSFSPRFIPDYFRYGEMEFELSRTASGRLAEFLYYLKSIYSQESGTYYIPDQRLEMTLIGVALILILLVFLFLSGSQETETRIWCNHTRVILAAVIGLTLGMLIIGRYNQTSVIFLLLPCYLIIVQLVLLFERTGRIVAIGLAISFVTWNSYVQIMPYLGEAAYDGYLAQLSELIPEDATTIANLNTGFYFAQGKLLDYRDLPYLNDKDELEYYVNNNRVQYICLTDELDYIYENRPFYNVIYGNAAFIMDLKSYCESDCIRIGSFEAPLYASRIIRLIGQPEYATVTVYQVIPDTGAAAL